jgi:DHA2 family multidrug resistance protein
MQASGMTPAASLYSFDNMVQNQSVMLATNHLFLIVGSIVAVTAVGIWLMPKPSGSLRVASAGH